MTELPCECPGPGFCERYQIQQGVYAHGICSATNCDETKSRMYRTKWHRNLTLANKPESVPISATTPYTTWWQGNGPGTELEKLLKGYGVRDSGCGGCRSLAVSMDQWGVEGCRVRRADIVEQLAKRWRRRSWSWGETLSVALAVLNPGAFRPDPFDILGSLVDEAIRRAENNVTSEGEVIRAGTD